MLPLAYRSEAGSVPVPLLHGGPHLAVVPDAAVHVPEEARAISMRSGHVLHDHVLDHVPNSRKGRAGEGGGIRRAEECRTSFRCLGKRGLREGTGGKVGG